MLQKFITTFSFLFLLFSSTFGQEGRLTVSSSALSGSKFYISGYQISSTEVRQILSEDKLALTFLNKGIKQQKLATIVSGIGGLLVGFPVGTAIAGREPKWWIAAAGGLIVGISFPIHNQGSRKIHTAVDMHRINSMGLHFNKKEPIYLTVSSYATGIGLQLQF